MVFTSNYTLVNVIKKLFNLNIRKTKFQPKTKGKLTHQSLIVEDKIPPDTLKIE